MNKLGRGVAPMAFNRLQVWCTHWDYVTTQNYMRTHTQKEEASHSSGYPEDLRVKGSLGDIQ